MSGGYDLQRSCGGYVAPASSAALARIPVGVMVERRAAKSLWLDFLWRPISVLAGGSSAAPWTPIGVAAETILFYAGEAVIELYRTETANYRDNLASGAYELLAVTADPAEGEAFTDAGNDLVETVPMPPAVARAIVDFVAEHHVERPFIKRRRERAEPQSFARCGDGRDNRK